MTRLLYLVSHPIQYQAPLLRRIAGEPGISLRVVFERDTSEGYFDSGFGVAVRWDVPLRQGYDSVLATETSLHHEIAAADVIWLHGWQGWRKHQALLMARIFGKPVLMRGENTEVAMPDGVGLRGLAKRTYLRWLFALVTGFLAIGNDNRRYYLRRGVPAERIFMMPYAVDNDVFLRRSTEVDTVAMRRRLNLPPSGPIILYAGKLIRRKHPHTLLRAWKEAAWKECRPTLLFVGDGEMADQLKAQAEDGVVFAGFRNQAELPDFYALADIFILASEAEPWGLAVNEAMACKTAVIVGQDIGCAADLVDETCGATVRAGDAAALAAAMVELLPRAKEAGLAAARRIESWNFEADVAGLRQALTWLEGRSSCV